MKKYSKKNIKKSKVSKKNKTKLQRGGKFDDEHIEEHIQIIKEMMANEDILVDNEYDTPVHKVYRKLALIIHPDRAPEDKKEQYTVYFQVVNDFNVWVKAQTTMNENTTWRAALGKAITHISTSKQSRQSSQTSQTREEQEARRAKYDNFRDQYVRNDLEAKRKEVLDNPLTLADLDKLKTICTKKNASFFNSKTQTIDNYNNTVFIILIQSVNIKNGILNRIGNKKDKEEADRIINKIAKHIIAIENKYIIAIKNITFTNTMKEIYEIIKLNYLDIDM